MAGSNLNRSLPNSDYFPTLKDMEVHFTPDVQGKLEQMARESGRHSEELLEDAVIGLFDELAFTRQTLDRRYDDLESGRVKPISGDEVFARLRAKSAAPPRQAE